MTLTAADLPRTAALTPRLQVVPRTGSTNADLVQAVATDAAAWPHLSVWTTDDQAAGRGRLGRTWTAPPGTALAISVVLRLADVPVTARGWIPLIAGAAMTHAVAVQLPAHDVRIKWPNDVLVAPIGGETRKICGILAEVVPTTDAIVVGAGVNTAMAADALPVSTATSFAALGAEADADRLIADYVRRLDELCTALSLSGGDAGVAGVRAEVSASCATLGSTVRVLLPGGGDLVGEAIRLGADGDLIVRTGEGESSVTAGDVVHVR